MATTSAVETPRGGLRERVRSNVALRQPYRVCVFVLGLFFIALGVALMALPGPLTIPPVLLGLWIWSTEFRFAERFFDSFKRKGHEAWAHAKRHPKSSSTITGGGVVLAAGAFWAVGHFHLVDRIRETLPV
jgi:drug/metabolite transporter (DMT)-like permease